MCNEQNFNDLISVLAIPANSFAWTDQAKRRSPAITAGSYTLPASGTMFIGRSVYRAIGASHSPQYSLPMSPESGEVKDEPSASVNGWLHKVVVSLVVDAKSAADFTNLRRLEMGEWALELCFFGDDASAPSRAVVFATEDTCLVTTEKKEGKVAVTITIENEMGLQVVFAS